jgi:ribonucleoside-diphosphate reductase alpha chain
MAKRRINWKASYEQADKELKLCKDSLALCMIKGGEALAKAGEELEQVKAMIGKPVRRRLPDSRHAVTHKFSIAGHEGYMTVGMFEDGSPGELFVTMAKEGSTIGGLMDTIGTLTSLSLQYGVNIETLAKKFSHQRFEPSGFTNNAEIRNASSVIDYVFRWMEIYFVKSRVVGVPVTSETPSPDRADQTVPG